MTVVPPGLPPREPGTGEETETVTETDPWAGQVIYSTAQLALFLGGSEDSFTGLLLVLMQKADPGNKARLAGAFPRETAAYDMWMSMSPAPTFAQLREALAGQDDGHRACAFTRDQLINALGAVPVSSAVAALEREGAGLGELADAIIGALGGAET